MIILYLPMIIVSSLFFGFESSLYCGISLIGFAFWKLSESPKYKKVGLVIFIIGTILFHITFVYYFITEKFFPENPFEFRMPDLILKSIFGFRDVKMPKITLFDKNSGKLDLAILFTIILIAYLVIQNLALIFSSTKTK